MRPLSAAVSQNQQRMIDRRLIEPPRVEAAGLPAEHFAQDGAPFVRLRELFSPFRVRFRLVQAVGPTERLDVE
jgi:hypothetical protein